MVGAYGFRCGLTSWGRRNGKQVWRVTWDRRPGMVADVTGPHDLLDVLTKLNDERVLVRLPWKERG